MKSSAPWSYVVGLLPHRVAAYEHVERKGVVYLRWRIAGDWRRKSLGFAVRDAKGRIDAAAERKAKQMADAQYGLLVTGGHAPAAPTTPLTIAQGWTLATDAERGFWTKDTPHRREMERAITRAKSVWGAGTAWNAIDRGEVRRLWRAELKRVRAKGQSGARSCEIVVARVMALAAWLREEGKIDATACAPWGKMKDEMHTDIGRYEPKRLRYTLEEYRRLLQHAPAVDARWGLLLTLGAEYRLGQVVRCRRSDYDAAAGTLRIQGSGKKRGTLVQLTGGQRRALDAALGSWLWNLSLARAEGRVADFPLFPGGRVPMRDGVPSLRGVHATRPHMGASHTLRVWLRETEKRAGVEHVPGRGWYGLRRIAVDAAKEAGISREGLQQHGGWSDTQVADRIYAEQEQMWAGKEAADIRAKIRGE